MVFVHFQKILERTQVGFFDANIYITLLPHLIESDYFLEHIHIKVKKFFLFVVKFCLPQIKLTDAGPRRWIAEAHGNYTTNMKCTWFIQAQKEENIRKELG